MKMTRPADDLLGRERHRRTSLHKSKLYISVDHTLFTDPVPLQPSFQNRATPSCNIFVGSRISAKVLQPVCDSSDQSLTVRKFLYYPKKNGPSIHSKRV